MADNLTTQDTTLATIPSGTVVSTDDAGASGHVQRVKLAQSGDGSAAHVQADADGVLVNLGENNDVVVSDGGGAVSVDDNGGTLSIDDGGGAITVDGTVTVTDGLNVEGDVAHDAADAGNPVKQGGKAIAHGAAPTPVAAADRTDWYFNRHGIPWVIGGHPNVVTVEAAYTAAQTDTAIVSAASGEKIVVTSILVTCDNANTADVGLRVGFGAANTPTTTGVVMTHPGIPAGSGVGRGDGSGILGVGADAEDLRITSEAPTTGSLRVLVTYYVVPS